MEIKRSWKSKYLKILFVILVVVIVIIGWFCCCRPITTVLIVRHAEKTMEGADPPLSSEGFARAQTLAHVAGEAGVTGIYTSQYLRTQQTAEPLSTQLGIPIIQVDSANVNSLTNQILSNHNGEVVVVVGHSNTIPLIIEELGGGLISPIQESEYDNLFVVTVLCFSRTKVLNLKYGNSS